MPVAYRCCMNKSLLAIALAIIWTVLLSPARSAIVGDHGTFSGSVSRVSTTAITISDATSHRAMRFLIAPTDGYGVLSPDGKTTYQMSAIRVGWRVKVAYDRTSSGAWHADHIVVLR